MNTQRRLIQYVTLAFTVLLVIACAAPSATPNETDMSGMDHSDTTMTDTNPTMEGMEHDMNAMEQGVAALEPLSGEAFEIGFLDAMIPHHQSAVEMAQIAIERAQRDEIKSAAQAIISAQETEISQMTAWLNDWYRQTPTGDDHGMSMTGEVDALRTVPTAEFDVAFLNAMIPHHESAVDMAKLVPNRTTRPELTTLADTIITTQTAEIAQYQGWLSAWE